MSWNQTQSRRRPAGVTRILPWLAVCVALTACGGGKKAGPPVVPIEVETTTVGVAPVEDRLAAVGSVLANETVELKPEAPGRIKSIRFQEGQRVTKGAVLFELNAEKETAQLAQSQAELELARQNAVRAETLSGTRAISRQEVDQLQSQVAFREAARRLQEERVQEMRLNAPFDGILGPRAVSPGQFVNVGTPLVTLTDDSVVKVLYRVPERHVDQLKPGQDVLVRVAAHPGREFVGKVDLINPVVDPATRTVEARALVPNRDGALKPGMFAHVETITDRRPAAVVVPERALVPSLTGFAVYLVNSNRAHFTPVKLGVRQPGSVEVREGLVPGRMLIVGGMQKIGDGSPVNPSPANLPTNGVSANSTRTAQP